MSDSLGDEFFGNLAESFSNHWNQCLKDVLENGFSSLPLMTEERSTRLKQHLLPLYERTLDVADIYIRQNIFSIQMFSSYRKERLLLSPNLEASLPTNPPTEKGEDYTYQQMSFSDRPSQAEILSLEEECKDLSAKLAAAKATQTRLQLIHGQTKEASYMALQATKTKILSKHILNDSLNQVHSDMKKLKETHKHSHQVAKTMITGSEEQPAPLAPKSTLMARRGIQNQAFDKSYNADLRTVEKITEPHQLRGMLASLQGNKN